MILGPTANVYEHDLNVKEHRTNLAELFQNPSRVGRARGYETLSNL